MTGSGLVFPTRAAASSPVELVPTTSMSPRQERMDSRPCLNMVWSSVRRTRSAAILGLLRHEKDPCRKARTAVANVIGPRRVLSRVPLGPGAALLGIRQRQWRASQARSPAGQPTETRSLEGPSFEERAGKARGTWIVA